MNPADLSLDAAGWLRFVPGLVVWLLPGLAAADRLFPSRSGLAFAPVLSVSLLALTGIVADVLLGVPLTATATVLWALAWTAGLQHHRVAAWLDPARPLGEDPGDAEQPNHVPVWRRPAVLLPVLGLVLACVFVAVVQSHPHFPAEGPGRVGVAEAPFELLSRLTGDGHPWPIHVDEHVHLARGAYNAREGTTPKVDTYTDTTAAENGVFTLRGDVQERGFWVGLAQFQLVTGIPWGTLFRFGPAVWAAAIAAMAWATVRPAPGAVASAAAIAVLPTTVQFMGVGFLVPIAFGLPWVLTALALATKASGTARLAGLWLVLTAAFFIHIVDGWMSFLVVLLVPLVHPGHWTGRVALAAIATAPLVWVLPSIETEVLANLAPLGHTTSRAVLTRVGPVIAGLAVVGAAIAGIDRRPETLPHRVLGLAALVLLIVFQVVLATGHTSLALWFRPVHGFLLFLAILAGLTAGMAGEATRRFMADRPRWAPAAGVAASFLVMAIAVPPAMQDQSQTPYYRVFDEASWQRGHDFAASGVRPGEVFLSEPWQAQVFNGLTGALPYAVLRNGGGITNGDAYRHYVESGGANATVLEAWGVDWVVHEIAPNATHRLVAPGVYRLA